MKFLTNEVKIALAAIIGIVILFAGMQFPARRNLKRALYYCVFALIIVATNPLFSHNGATVLFSAGRFSVSLEAFFYGGGMAALMIGVIVWCELLSEIGRAHV